jgi:hypothetical protein
MEGIANTGRRRPIQARHPLPEAGPLPAEHPKPERYLNPDIDVKLILQNDY